ncbi:cell wall-binding repeat-containing protein [Candidatus Poriferisodalis sp.]|uniref:cell wall-binding repeat-containing protein n=1 Tax=Candidatus Poriferisodalis sp. TaxID=3101277 RepID=UPI003B524409
MAGLLCASVLAVVAGSPAHAANTSRELLVDTNSDGIGDAREFGGRDRYDTALRLAKNFAKGKGGLGTVPVAFIASGVTLVDAVSVSGLAGLEEAPVLLTPSESLHNGVADYIEDNGVDTVYVLGGSAAVADSVLEDMRALPNAPLVTRIEGPDRYATAAAIASTLGVGASWCGGDVPAAILVNGGDVSLAYAMMIGPIAYRLKLPVLMTAADELPSATTDFIRSEDVEHVVIVGGTASVSAGVEGALTDAGVDTVDRIAGDFAAGTSVELAKLALGSCADDLDPVSGDTVALVHGDALPDGVAAAPVLASTFDGGRLVPVLLVGDTLPTSVRDYLAATPDEDDDGDKVELKIVAIGGTAAVSTDVVDGALDTAASAGSLAVQIGASSDKNQDGTIDADDVPAPGDNSVILYFSGPLDTGSSSLTSIIRDIVELNNAPALLAAGNSVTLVSADDACEPERVTVSFSHPLRAGDTISIPSGVSVGTGANATPVRPASVTVIAPAVVRTRPTIDVFMVAGRFSAEVTISEGGPLNEEDVDLRSANPNLTVSVNPATSDLIFSEALEVGDRVVVRRGAVSDAGGNLSAQRTYSTVAPDKNPRILSVLMSELSHSGQASTRVPAAISGEGNRITISARAGGAADGAEGNAWTFIFDVASGWTPTGEVDIAVQVSSDDETVFVRFNDGAARNRDLADALEADSTFDSMFEVEPPANRSGGCGSIRNLELSLGTNDRQVTAAAPSGGVTEVAIEVRFNGYVETVDDDGLLADILRAVVSRTDAVDPLVVQAALGLDAPIPFEGPGKVVRYEAVTQPGAAAAKFLPRVRDLVDTPAGRDTVFDDPDTDADESAEPVAAIATGYAPPENDDEKNGRSQVRIARSASVKPPG